MTKPTKNTDPFPVVKFYCPTCGQQMWESVPIPKIWGEVRELSLDSLKWQAECSDCILISLRKETKSEDLQVLRSGSKSL